MCKHIMLKLLNIVDMEDFWHVPLKNLFNCNVFLSHFLKILSLFYIFNKIADFVGLMIALFTLTLLSVLQRGSDCESA